MSRPVAQPLKLKTFSIHRSLKLRPFIATHSNQATSDIKSNMAVPCVTSMNALPKDFGLNFFGSRPLTLRSKERGYNYFLNSYVFDVKLQTSEEKHAFVSSKCYQSMRKNETPHKLHMDISTEERRFTDCNCTCVAGMSGTCSHILALVFTLIHYQQKGLKEVPTSLSCTSLPQQWHRPRGTKIKPRPVVNMILAKAKRYATRKKRPVFTKTTKQRLVPPTKTEIQQLKSTLKNSAIAYLVNENNNETDTALGRVQQGSPLIYQAKFYNQAQPYVSATVSSTCGDVIFPQPVEYNLTSPSHLQCNSIEPITHKDAVDLEKATVLQSESSLWFKCRAKRITASQFGRILKRKKDINEKFLKSLFDADTFSSQATSYGKRHEGDAKGAYVEKNRAIHVHDCGLVVNPAFSFLGASPDGKVCDMGKTGILEVKCPYSARDMILRQAVQLPNFCLEANNDSLQLKRGHDYEFQVQGQLLVTGAPFCEFVVYTSKDLFVQRIFPEKTKCQQMLMKLADFYCKYAIPYITRSSE